MYDILIHQEISRLDSLFEKISEVEDEEMQAHWAKYLCVLVSGSIENALKHFILKYASEKSHPYVSNYINNNIRNITNLNNKKILNLLGSFSEQWRVSYENTISDEERDAIDSIIANRNNIAHGKSVGLTYVRVKTYYEKVKNVIRTISSICIT